MAEKRYYWLKLNEDYFANPKIKKLRKIAGGDTFTIIYLKMQLLSVSNKGIITFEGIENTIEEELALKLDEQIEDVQLTMAYLKTQGLVECSENEYLLIDACKNIGSECESAERVRNFRERQKSLQSNNAVTSMKQNSISISDSISNNKEYNKENILKESSDIQETNSSSNTNLTSSTMFDLNIVSKSSKPNALTSEKVCITDTGSIAETKPSHTNKLSVDSGKEKEDKVLEIYTYWNSKDIVVHRKISKPMERHILNALKDYSVEEIKKAIDNYNTVIKDKDYFFAYVWSLDTFIKQSNGLPHFVDSGEKWLNYCKKKGIANKPKVEVKQIKEGLYTY